LGMLLPLLTALAILLAVPSLAQEQVLRLDPGESRVTFTLGATLHTVEGKMALKEGEIRFDRATGNARGRIVFDAARTTTDNEGRDEKMHAEVLESTKFPEIVFSPSKMTFTPKGAEGGTIVLSGTVSIHGAQKAVEVRADVTRAEDKVTADGTLQVPYVAWGMHDPSVFVLRVAKVVEVRIHAAGTLSPQEPR